MEEHGANPARAVHKGFSDGSSDTPSRQAAEHPAKPPGEDGARHLKKSGSVLCEGVAGKYAMIKELRLYLSCAVKVFTGGLPVKRTN